MSVERGRAAETLAADYLAGRGFEVLDRNWRNRWCELDIVARRGGVVHFVEVKYRRRADWGTGFEAITSDKAQRLRRAALAWNQTSHHSGDYQIDIISVAGELDQAIIDYLPSAIGD